MTQNYNLQKFITAHQQDYAAALSEIRNGKKLTHWMWYIFPQVHGLGRSSTSRYFAIESLYEAIAFLEDPYLGENLREICHALLQLETNNATEVFGRPDDTKLRSSMTLFALAAGESSVFHKVLEKFFDGNYDEKTQKILNSSNHSPE